jgi:hypothetical protein
MNLRPLTAAAVLTAAIASPALAMGPHARSEAVQHKQQQARAYQYGPQHYGYYGSYDRSGFWPVDVAAGLVGGAIGTAGAIATAPFSYDAYAYNGYHGPYSYNGFSCAPGTTFIGADGLRHLCR